MNCTLVEAFMCSKMLKKKQEEKEENVMLVMVWER